LAGFTVTYTATSSANSSISASGTIQILGVAVSVSPASANVLATGTQSFVATVTNDPTNSGVTFTVSCSPAPCGEVPNSPTPSGTPITYTAPPTPPPSDLAVTVTATSVAYTGATGTASVTVPAITVAVSPVSALIPLNSKGVQFTGTVANDLTNSAVSWTLVQSSNSCSPACGSTSAPNPTTYTPPASMPANSGVTLTATSVADPTKFANAALNLSTGTVQLVPQSWNFGRVIVNHVSSAHAFTLTNTGATALTITGITFAETDPNDFSQSNTCGSSVAAAASCSISVVFKPGAQGTRSATMSIADTSIDSPQQISLNGTGYTVRASDVPAVNSVLASSPFTATPVPTGPEPVGTRVLHWVDLSRPDPFLDHSVSRELLIRLWYPASLNRPCEPADYTSPRVWSYFSHLLGIPLPAVTTNSCLDAPVASGIHPVVVFTHGYTGTFTDYTFLCEDLASRGYIVASVNHTYEATATEFPDGRFVTSLLGSHFNDTWRGDEKTLAFASSVRLQDLRFVLSQLQRINTRNGNPFAHRLDLSRLAIAGHSAGGTIAFQALQQDSRFKAAVVLDGFLSSSEIHPTTEPVLILRAGAESHIVDRCALSHTLRGPHSFVNLSGAEHLTPSDALWLARGAIASGHMGTDATVAAIRDYVAAFLDTYLRERPIHPLLSGSSAIYPDAAVSTGDQSCSQP
jgi:predicted dienelactone hydrolase